MTKNTSLYNSPGKKTKGYNAGKRSKTVVFFGGIFLSLCVISLTFTVLFNYYISSMFDLFFITLNLELSFNFSSMEPITCPERMNLVIYFSCHLAVLKLHICVEWDFQLWTICLCYLLASLCGRKSCLAACKLGTSLWWIFYLTILVLAYWIWSTYMIGRCL
jgi:hypothetical protein